MTTPTIAACSLTSPDGLTTRFAYRVGRLIFAKLEAAERYAAKLAAKLTAAAPAAQPSKPAETPAPAAKPAKRPFGEGIIIDDEPAAQPVATPAPAKDEARIERIHRLIAKGQTLVSRAFVRDRARQAAILARFGQWSNEYCGAGNRDVFLTRRRIDRLAAAAKAAK